MVLVVAGYDLVEPYTDLTGAIMLAALKLNLDGFELRSHAHLRSDSPDGEGLCLVTTPPVVGEAQEREGLPFPFPTLIPVTGRIASKLDQPGLDVLQNLGWRAVSERIAKWEPDRRSSNGVRPKPASSLCTVRWYLRYSLSLRDVEELLEERGLYVDHTTVWRWVQDYGPELEQRLRKHLKPTSKSWRVDETYVRVKGRWCYLYRAIDSGGATIDFLLSALGNADAAKRLFRKALGDRFHPQPRVINTDLAPIYSSAIPDSKKEGTLRNRCRHRPMQYLNNILEQDH